MKRIIIESSIQSFEQKMAEKDTSNNFFISLRMLSNYVLFMDIPISSIFDRCIQLELKLKNFNTNQEDFDTFCNQFLKFTVLEQFSFRFYSKVVQNLDNLFTCTQNIKDVSLRLNNFQKIQLSDIVLTSPKIEQLELSILNATFKNNSIDNLSHYIHQLKGLKKLKINLNKFNQLPILSQVDNVEVCLNLSQRPVDKSFCDKLKIIIDEKKQGKQFSVKNARAIISSYLQHIGVKNIFTQYGQLITNCYDLFQNTWQINYFSLFNFEYSDFELLKQTTFFVDYISHFDDKNSVAFYVQRKYIKQLYDSVICKVENSFKQVICSSEFDQIRKEKLYWNINVKDDNFKNILNIFQNSLYLNLTIMFDSEDQIQPLSKVLSKYQNLISLQLNQNVIPSQYLKQLELLVQRKCEAKLRYFAFKKTIYDLIPLPYQLFFDLFIE